MMITITPSALMEGFIGLIWTSDFLAAFMELVGYYYVERGYKFGFILGALANLLWIYIGIQSHIYGLLLICIPGVLVFARNFHKWNTEEFSQKARWM